jgi:2-polyprenyl-3-methyl-5-hydroxy-6-metoxy-1,4-benzoquinol methylase
MSRLPSLRARFGEYSDAEWLHVLERSLEERVIAGAALPGFPPDEVQIRTVGSAGAHALREAFAFYAFVKRMCARHGVELSAATKILDFGIGWGRIARFFLKDVDAENLYGADVDRELVRVCADTALPVAVAHVEPKGSLPFAHDEFDLVTAYSVFTHLPEPVQDTWLAEISRAMVPGALFVATVQSPRTFELFRAVDPDDDAQHFWHRRVASRLRKHPGSVRAFSENGFAFLPSRAERWDDPAETFGNTFVSPRYVERHWGAFFEIVEYHDAAEYPQAIVVARAR